MMAENPIFKIVDLPLVQDIFFSDLEKIYAATMMTIMLPAISKNFLGITEEDLAEIMEKIGMKRENILCLLSKMTIHNLIIHSLSQEGTAGPFAHRYRINEEKVRIKFLPPSAEEAS